MAAKKPTGRPASYSAEYFPHMANHDGEPHVRNIERKWGLPGYAIYYKLFEKLSSSQHHFLLFKTEDDKFDLFDQLRPAPEKAILEVIDYLLTKLVLDQALYDQGIIYSPYFVNTLSTLYRKRSCKPLIPEIDKNGKLIKKVCFTFNDEKYRFSTVKDVFSTEKDVLQKEKSANNNKDYNTEEDLRESSHNKSNTTAPSELENKSETQESKTTPAGAVDSVDDEDKEILLSKDVSVPVPVPVPVSDQDTKPPVNVNDIVKKTAKLKSIDTTERANTAINCRNIFLHLPFVREISKSFDIAKGRLTELYNQYGSDRLLDCYAYTIYMNNKGKVKSKPAGYFIKALEQDYKITKNDEFCRIKSDILDRNPDLH